jgi:hypothetical protein
LFFAFRKDSLGMKHEWADDELIEHWALLPNELEWLTNKTICRA